MCTRVYTFDGVSRLVGGRCREAETRLFQEAAVEQLVGQPSSAPISAGASAALSSTAAKTSTTLRASRLATFCGSISIDSNRNANGDRRPATDANGK